MQMYTTPKQLFKYVFVQATHLHKNAAIESRTSACLLSG